MSDRLTNISIIGDGGWGTTLAVHLARKGYRVRLWGAFPDYVRQVRKTRINSKFLPGVKIPPKVELVTDLKSAIQGCGLVVLAVPSQYLQGVLECLKHLDLRGKAFLSVIKGIDCASLMRMSQIIEKSLGRVPLAVLSGPTIAMEVAREIPTTAVIAARDAKFAQALQTIFHSRHFRIYTNDDVVGVELGGSVKNIIAIASGVCDGLGFGTNTKAAILTRGLAEMTRLGKALGARKETFFGLTGLGDLVTTCMSPRSRNRSVGEALGKGRSIKQITSSMQMVAEGVETAKAVHRLDQKLRIDMPITREVYRIIYKNKKPRKAVEDLMRRQRKAE